MTVTKAKYGNWVSLTGTLVEVMTQINLENISKERMVAMYYDTGLSKTVCIIGKN